jgi:hypothetical protein
MVILLIELITLPLAFATFELTTIAVFELVETAEFTAFAATALIRALVFAFDPFVLELCSEQPAKLKATKVDKIVTEKIFIFTPIILLESIITTTNKILIETQRTKIKFARCISI